MQYSLQLQVTTRPLFQNSKHLIFSFSLVLGCVGNPPCDRQSLLAQVAKFATQITALEGGRSQNVEVFRGTGLCWELHLIKLGDLFHDFSASLCSESCWMKA